MLRRSRQALCVCSQCPEQLPHEFLALFRRVLAAHVVQNSTDQ